MLEAAAFGMDSSRYADRGGLLRMTWLTMAAVYERAFAEQRDLMLWERLEHRK